MKVRAAVLVVAMLASCERKAPSSTKPPAEACLADEIAQLHVSSKKLAHCTGDGTECRRDCAAGDGDACFNLAVAQQMKARDVETDSPQVTDDFKRACKLGVATGCTNWAAGRLFSNAPGPLSCLYRVFDKACDAGDPYGCTMTARLMVEWSRTPVDVWIGYVQLTNACAKFDGPPCRFLAVYIERGIFESKDPARVKALMAQACRGHDEYACGHETAEETLTSVDSAAPP